jgi:hypothetical protein
MDQAFDQWFTAGSAAGLLRLLPELQRIYPRLARAAGDWRTGEETYGYNNVGRDLSYISDRWRVAFRVRWLTDGLRSGKIL